MKEPLLMIIMTVSQYELVANSEVTFFYRKLEIEKNSISLLCLVLFIKLHSKKRPHLFFPIEVKGSLIRILTNVVNSIHTYLLLVSYKLYLTKYCHPFGDRGEGLT